MPTPSHLPSWWDETGFSVPDLHLQDVGINVPFDRWNGTGKNDTSHILLSNGTQLLVLTTPAFLSLEQSSSPVSPHFSFQNQAQVPLSCSALLGNPQTYLPLFSVKTALFPALVVVFTWLCRSPVYSIFFLRERLTNSILQFLIFFHMSGWVLAHYITAVFINCIGIQLLRNFTSSVWFVQQCVLYWPALTPPSNSNWQRGPVM